MTTRAKVAALAPILRTRSHHALNTGKEAREQLRRFGKAARKMRLSLKLDQETVATQVGVSPAQISNFELGRNWPSMPVFRKLCLVLGVELPVLMK